MGSLFTSSDGAEITGIGNGAVELDFMAGTVTLPDGTVSNMNKNLNDLGLNQCNSYWNLVFRCRCNNSSWISNFT